MLRQSIYWRYLALSVLFSKTCHFYLKCCHRDWDAWHETQREWDLWQADKHMHAETFHTPKNKRRIHAGTCTKRSFTTHTDRTLACARTHRLTRTHLDFSGCCCVSSASVGASVSSPYSTCGAIISWHTYPPLNDFSSSSASHLIKVESLMPFRDPTAFNCIHCHYENEWRQLRTQMFFHIMTESLLMCLVIFSVAAFDWRPWSGTRLIMLHIIHITFRFYIWSVAPALWLTGMCVAHWDH